MLMYKSQEFFKYTVVYAWYVMCARGSTDIMRLYVLMINHLNTKEILIAFGTTEIRQYQKKITFQCTVCASQFLAALGIEGSVS